jgi:hypothetical protein
MRCKNRKSVRRTRPRFFTFTLSMLVFLLLSVSFSARQLQTVQASSNSPYDSGFDHGCDDADISDPDDRYINQPGKGPSFHTDEFMSGYDDGYDDCSISSSNSNSANEDEGSDESWNDSCYDAGYDDGQNGPFSEPTWDHCGDEEGGDDSYYDGFIDGCMDADNARDVCESASDAGE